MYWKAGLVSASQCNVASDRAQDIFLRLVCVAARLQGLLLISLKSLNLTFVGLQ